MSSQRPQIGGIAQETDGTAVGLVAEGEHRSALFSRDGRQFCSFQHPYFFQTTVAYSAATTAALALISAPSTGTSIYITDVVFTSDTAGAMSLVQRATASSLNILNARIQPGGGFFAHSFQNPIRANTADTTTAVVNVGLTTTMTTTTAVITGYFGP